MRPRLPRHTRTLGNKPIWDINMIGFQDMPNKIDDLELSVHVDDKAYYFLKGKVEQLDSGGWRLVRGSVGDIEIFSCFTFPLLEISKTEMRSIAKEHGFL